MDINLLQIFVLVAIVIVSMSLHEMTHAFVGYWLGDDTAKVQGRLSFNPLAHIDPFMTVLLPVLLMLMGAPIFGGAKPVPFDPSRVRWGEFGAMLVGISGPISNLLLAFVGFGVLAITGLGGDIGYVLQLWIVVNLGFMLFNILPIPPLDGSRLLYYLAPDFIRNVMRMMEQYGIVVVFAVVLFFSQFIGLYIQSGIDFFVYLFGLPFGLMV